MTAPLASQTVPRSDVVAVCATTRVPNASKNPTNRVTTRALLRIEISSPAGASPSILFAQEVSDESETLGDPLGRYCATAGPQSSSLIFNVFGVCETFEYGFSQTAFQIQERSCGFSAGFRWMRCVLPMNSAAAAIMTTG